MDFLTQLGQIRQLIAKNELSTALQSLQNILAHSSKLSEIIQQNARFAALSEQIRLGTVRYDDATLTQNQILMSLLDLINEMEKESLNPEVAAELEKPVLVQNSKNVVIGSTIQAGGDVHIGDKNIGQQADKIYNIKHIDNADFS